MKIISVVGARPNFMKIAPFMQAIDDYNRGAAGSGSPIIHRLIHTGQHYDASMSETFFQALGIPEPDINLGIGSGSHAEQVGGTMIALEQEFLKEQPDWVVVLGDVNATLSASVTAKKLLIRVCHIESGLRSRDMSMPEEINRLVTDRLADLLLTPDRISVENLQQEGVPGDHIRFVGNIMIDTLENNRDKARALSVGEIINTNMMDSQPELVHIPHIGSYALLTLHRPSNVDDESVLSGIIGLLIDDLSIKIPILWPIHPRSVNSLKKFGLWERVIQCPGLILLQPLGYHQMLRLNMDARLMLTDSGGLQEECTVLGTPCLTMRWNTERPITLQEHGGASVLVGNHIDRIREAFLATLQQDRKPERPPLWDGKTAKRCLEAILRFTG